MQIFTDLGYPDTVVLCIWNFCVLKGLYLLYIHIVFYLCELYTDNI